MCKVKGHITVLLRYNVLTTKTYPGGLLHDQVHFTLKSEEIQSIIEYSVKDDVSKNILTTVFNQLMENQRTEYIQAKNMNEQKTDKVNEMAIMSAALRHV